MNLYIKNPCLRDIPYGEDGYAGYIALNNNYKINTHIMDMGLTEVPENFFDLNFKFKSG